MSGWPLGAEQGFPEDGNVWEPSDDRMGRERHGVTHWLEFPVEFWNLGKVENSND